MAALHQLLKVETAPLHRRLDGSPFFAALQAGLLPKLAIVSFLRCLAIIHAVLEREIASVANPGIAALARQAGPKLALLVADLETLDTESLPSIGPGIDRALDFAAAILADADNPLSLVAMLYMLEGSQNGAALKRAYARCLDIGVEQLSYIGCYGSETAAHWKAFTTLLDALALDDEEAIQVKNFAVQGFGRIEALLAALYPYAENDLRYRVAAINFEAGDHAMPQDPREVDLALRAGRAAWQQYPYLERRFGERGKRFTCSDSCWLVALTRMPVEIATKNLEWLRTVLASRGIPTIVLETHLRLVAQGLAVSFPEQIDKRERFDRFLANLDAERRALGGASAALSLIEPFERRFRGCVGSTVESAAQLIAAAWIDERSGIDGALPAVRDWFADTRRFSSDWIATVDALVTALDRAGETIC